ncbi:MAG TPA: hypothetical protein VKT52_06085 [Ktedonobacterales bacterium]|nr:hypothetical protein [Ktedonobacterales bacterium]
MKSNKLTRRDDLALHLLPRLRALLRDRASAPLSVAGVVLFIYVACTLVMFRAGAVATDFAMVGAKFAHKSTASSVITFGPSFHYAPLVGYDGQFCYFIALDPQNARYYIDAPAYRYERILYPLVARALALGQSALIPYTLILVNILAISGGALLLAYWLRRRGVSPWLALLYGLYSGLFIGYRRDLTEPLGYGLVILAISCFDVWRRRALWTGLVFGLAALAREATLLFAVVYVAALLFESPSPATDSHTRITSYLQRIRHNWRPAALMLALAVGPFLAYKVFLTLWLGTSGTPTSLFPSLIPFSGLILMLQPQRHTLVQLFLVCAPGLVCFALSLWAILRRRATVEIWALFANAAFFVVLLNPVWYEDSAPATTRIGIGIVLAALLAIPSFDALLKRDRRWLIACAPVWMSYTGLYLAVTALFVFTGVIVWPFLR